MLLLLAAITRCIRTYMRLSSANTRKNAHPLPSSLKLKGPICSLLLDACVYEDNISKRNNECLLLIIEICTDSSDGIKPLLWSRRALCAGKTFEVVSKPRCSKFMSLS
jgi:hypothetical protein